MFAFVIAVGAYYYDLNSADKKTLDAEYVKRETEDRCRKQHESMCKYFLTVKLPKQNLEYTFRVPRVYYHGTEVEVLKARRYPVIYKVKKIFPAAILGLTPKYQAEIDPIIKQDG
ncbi:MAG: hypothetical protein ACAI44_07010 [Candidatus Sericytochromatia bacterium]